MKLRFLWKLQCKNCGDKDDELKCEEFDLT